MFAISLRNHLSEAVTDVLVERGDQLVLMSTVKNRSAKLSNAGFSILVQRTEGDEGLAVRHRRTDRDAAPFVSPIASEGLAVCP